MSAFPSLEYHSLKKKSYCPPDVYNQRDEQKEDLMSEDFVRDGYKYIKPVRDEYDSCRKESKFLTVNDSLWKFYHDVLARKYDCSTYQDLKKKSLSNVRETVVPVVDKTQANAWFRELAGSTSLQILGRRVPHSKDKQEILNELLIHKVPISRALWLINLILLHTPAQPENAKRKQRPAVHPSEWTSNLCQMLEQRLGQLCVESADPPGMEEDWDYLFTLLLALYDSDVADHWEVLLWLAKRVESLWKQPVNNGDDAALQSNQHQYPNFESNEENPVPSETMDETNMLNNLKFFLFYVLKFGRRFTENELITRRVLFWCCSVFHNIVFGDSRLQTTTDNQNANSSDMQLVLDEYLETCSCPLHRTVVLSLSSLITCLTLSCPSAAVWNSIPTETDHTYLKGSPLDVIPYSCAALPMPRGSETTEIRQCLFDVETVIIDRSKSAEAGWNRQAFADVNGEEMERLVKVLDILDRQDYHTVKEHNPMEALFNRIFNDDAINVDTDVLVATLCEWAVSVHRVGTYRSVIVACLLEQLTHTFQSDPNPFQLLQQTLVDFLDTFASNLTLFSTDRAPTDSEPMRNLVCLFAELIDREVFDHDAYVRRMIARGAFTAECHPLAASAGSESHALAQTNLALPGTSTHGKLQTTANTTLLSNLPNNVTTQCSVASEMSEDNDRCSVDNPDSVRSETGFPSAITTTNNSSALSTSHHMCLEPSAGSIRCSPHFHYLTQFPLPQDESYAHEENQRYQLLYGSLRARDRARSRIRQLVRDIVKLFTRKFYLIDVVHGEMCKRKKSKDREREASATSVANIPSTGGHRAAAAGTVAGSGSGVEDTHLIDKLHEDIISRFICLSYHDMECVISQCTPTFMKVLSGCTGQSNPNLLSDDYHTGSTLSITNPPSPPTASTNPPLINTTNQSPVYLPVPNSIFLFFELIETSLNITSLLATIVDTLERLQTLFESRTPFMTLYMSSVCLRSIGILQRHQPVLFTMGDLSNRLFPALIAQVRQVREPTQCGPFERCVLAYLNDLFTSNAQIKSHFASVYNKALPKVAALFRSVEPSEGLGTFDPEYASELFKAIVPDYPSLFRFYAEDLRKNPNSRFSFVCRAVIFVCQATTVERVNYLCGLCAELTSHCGDLTSEWLGALYAVLAPRPYRHGYGPVVNAVEPSDMNMYDSVSSLIGTLLFRRCMTISDFLCRVICPAMAQGLVQPVGPQLEPSIRLACHILHRLFTAESTASTLQTNSTVLTPSHELSATSLPQTSTINTNDLTTPPFRISEPFLLTGALQKVTPELLVDVLKMLVVHNDKACLEDQGQSGIEVLDEANEGSDSDTGQADEEPQSEDHPRRRVSASKTLHAVVQRFLESGVLPTVSELRNLPLIGLIQLVLREICSVPWVRERFFRMPSDRWTRENVLIDKKFSPTQARRLLHVIFHPFDLTWSDTSSLATAMCQLLSSLDLWTMRCALVKFQLLYTQIRFSQQKDVLDSVGQAIVRGFQTQALSWLKFNGSGMSADVCLAPVGGFSRFELEESDPVWLVPVLIAKLPRQLKVQIVTGALEILQGIKHFWKHKNDEDKECELLKHSIVLAHPAFFRLLQVCLTEIDPIDKLYEQVGYFVENANETEDRVPDNLRTRQVVQECLRLRLTLVGQCFKALQKEHELTTDWSLLLTKLISYGVIEPESNTSLFYMVYDMLQSLVHTMAARSGIEGKHYQNLSKKIRRELSKRPSYGVEQIRLLLPPLKAACTVIVTGHNAQRLSASGSSGTSEGGGAGSGANKSGGIGKVSNSKGLGKGGGGGHHGSAKDGGSRRPGKKRGFTIIGQERLAPWDLQDPSKQAMLLSMHGATPIEAIPSRTEEQANRLIRHDHFIRLRRPPEFYLNPVYPEEENAKVADNRSDVSERSTSGPPANKSLKVEAGSSDSGMLPPNAVSAKSTSNFTASSYGSGLVTSDGTLRVPTTKLHGPNTISEPKGAGRGTDRTCPDSLIYEELRRPPPTTINTSGSKLSGGLSEFTFDPAVAANSQLPPSSAYAARSFQSEYQQNYHSSFGQMSRHTDVPFSNVSMHPHGNTASQMTNSMMVGQHAERFAPEPFHAQPKHRNPNMDKNYPDNFIPSSELPGTHNRSIRVSNKQLNDHGICADPVTNDSMSMNSGPSMAPVVTTKRKRGSGRRGNSSAGVSEHGLYGTTGQRTANQGSSTVSARTSGTLGHKLSTTGQLPGHPMHGHPGPTSELGVMDLPPGQDPTGTNWMGKPVAESQPSRSSTSMDSLRGFMRNRMQQQRASAAALQQQQQQQQTYSSFMNPTVAQSSIRSSEHSELLTGGSTYGQSAEVGSAIPYSSSVHTLNTYPSNEVAVTYNQQPNVMNPTHLVEQPIRQLGSGTNVTRYVTQFNPQRSGGMVMHPANAKQAVQRTHQLQQQQAQQIVPNPPPYPLSAQQQAGGSVTHQMPSNQQHAFARAQMEDNYVVVLENQGDEQRFARMETGQTMGRHASYPSGMLHQATHQQQMQHQPIPGEPISIQLMHHPSTVSYTRIADPGPLARADTVLHPSHMTSAMQQAAQQQQQQQQQSQYSRYTTY